MLTSYRLRLSAFVLLLFVPIVLLVFWISETQRYQLIDAAQQDALSLAQAIGNEYRQYIDSGHSLLALLAQLPIIREKQVDVCDRLLAVLHEENPVYNGIFVADSETGIGLCSSDPYSEPFDNTPFAWFQAVLNTRDFVVSEYRIGPLSGRSVVTLGYPVVDEQGEMTAVVAASLSLGWLNTFAETSILPPNSAFTVLDGQGTVLIRYPEAAALVGAPYPGETVRLALLNNAQGVIRSVGLDQTPRIYAYAPIAPGYGDIRVLVSIPESVALVNADYVRDRSILVLVGIALLGIAGAWLNGSLTVRPIHDLTGAVRRITAGELYSRSTLQSNIDELQQLIVAFNQMATVMEQRSAAQVEQLTSAHAERLKLLEAEQQAREKAEQAVTRLQLLQTITSDLIGAQTLSQVADRILLRVVPALGSHIGTIALLSDDGMTLNFVGTATLPPLIQERYPQISMNMVMPGTDTARTRKPVWIESEDQFAERYPDLVDIARATTNTQALACLPLLTEGHAIGVMSVSFRQAHSFDPDEQAFLLAVALHSAHALERVRLTEKQRELVVIQERHRLARELHDAVSQALFSASLITQALPGLWKRNPEKAIAQLEPLHQIIRGASAELRTLLWALRPESVIQTKLATLIQQLSSAVQARKKMAVCLLIRGDEELTVPPDVHLVFYRVAQESIHNVLKHGDGTCIVVFLKQTPRYTALVVKDDGRGFDTESNHAGLGLTSMHERAASIGATLGITSEIGRGTRVCLRWTVPPETITQS